MSNITEAEALKLLLASHPGLRPHSWEGQQLPQGWFFTFAKGYAMPFGDPSWLILDDGRVGSVQPRESLAAALERLLATEVVPAGGTA